MADQGIGERLIPASRTFSPGHFLAAGEWRKSMVQKLFLLLPVLSLVVLSAVMSACVYDPRTEEEKFKDRLATERFEMQLRTDQEKKDWSEYKQQWDNDPPASSGKPRYKSF
ncbi:hypothetical protein F6V25_10680 [Oryzomonas japonica]|uniref:Uncharacterized protein n=1 Tax=Oryzomonas japonica TaxID=2603858 RepID=A0A7J4ZQD3_9BACT|nr:hypothetical protein [Oryzomonas japonica]KAB0665081.1 hypothetical protein F6V25_10680 [Oryzomonas japonica]